MPANGRWDLIRRLKVKLKEKYFVKNIGGTSLSGDMFIWPLEPLIQNLPVLTKRTTVILITVKTRNALLPMLPVCISIALKSVTVHKFLILDPYHPNTLYLREQGCDDPWLFFETKRGAANKSVWETLVWTTEFDAWERWIQRLFPSCVVLRITEHGRTDSVEAFRARHGLYTKRFMYKLAL